MDWIEGDRREIKGSDLLNTRFAKLSAQPSSHQSHFWRPSGQAAEQLSRGGRHQLRPGRVEPGQGLRLFRHAFGSEARARLGIQMHHWCSTPNFWPKGLLESHGGFKNLWSSPKEVAPWFKVEWSQGDSLNSKPENNLLWSGVEQMSSTLKTLWFSHGP